MREVLHVLPHPGGGGETYIDAIAPMSGYRFDRFALVPAARPPQALRSVARGALSAHRRARRSDLVHVHGELAAAICLPSLALRRSVVTLHGLHLLRRSTGWRRAPAAANLRLIVRAASRTICVSEAEHEDALRVVSARHADRLVVIRNGVDPRPAPTTEDRLAVRQELGVSPSATMGIWVGSLDAHKDPLVPVRAAIDVARDGTPLMLAVAGDGPLRPMLQDVVSRDATGAIQLLGHRRDVERLVSAADFFVLSSHREGLSFAVLEAMSLGLPVVVSNTPGNPEAVGDTGIVVPVGDVARFEAAFRRLLHEPERRALGGRARERVVARFTAAEMIRRTKEVYDEVVGRGRLS